MARISQEEKEKVREKILNISSNLFFSKGYDKTSIKVIAKEVGIAEGTIFNYFDSKSEIFFEVFYNYYIENSIQEEFIKQNEDNVVSAICENVFRITNQVLNIPRGVMIELGIESIKMAKNRPDLFKKFALLDFQYMEDLTKYLEELIGKGILVKTNASCLSEMIFATMVYEFLIYFYDKLVTKEEVNEKITKKIEMLLKGYVKEETICQ